MTPGRWTCPGWDSCYAQGGIAVTRGWDSCYAQGGIAVTQGGIAVTRRWDSGYARVGWLCLSTGPEVAISHFVSMPYRTPPRAANTVFNSFLIPGLAEGASAPRLARRYAPRSRAARAPALRSLRSLRPAACGGGLGPLRGPKYLGAIPTTGGRARLARDPAPMGAKGVSAEDGSGVEGQQCAAEHHDITAIVAAGHRPAVRVSPRRARPTGAQRPCTTLAPPHPRAPPVIGAHTRRHAAADRTDTGHTI